MGEVLILAGVGLGLACLFVFLIGLLGIWAITRGR